MKFDIGDLVYYKPAEDQAYTGVILKKAWRGEMGSVWFYKLYFIEEEDEAWIEEQYIQNFGGHNGI